MSRLDLFELPTTEPPDADVPEGTGVQWLDLSVPVAPRLVTKVRINSTTVRSVKALLVP